MFLQMWGKTEDKQYIPVWKHMLDVGIVARELAANSHYHCLIQSITRDLNLPLDQVVQLASFLASIHDLSKITPQFQFKMPAPANRDILRVCPASQRYASLGEGFNHAMQLRHYLRDLFRDCLGWSGRALDLYQVPSCHHYFPVHDLESGADGLEPEDMRFWVDARRSQFEFLRHFFLREDFPVSFSKDSMDRVCTTLAAFTILSDWIASDQKQYQHIGTPDDPEEYLDWSRAQAQQILENMDLRGGLNRPFPESFHDRFPQFRENNWTLKPIQRLVVDEMRRENLPPGLAIIEAPMGDGKTEAAMHLATTWMEQSGRSGLYFALPTTATANQMYGRITEYIGLHQGKEQLIRLLHGKAWLREPPPILCEDPLANDFFMGSRRGLLQRFGVGTVDQIMKGAMYIKYGAIRLLGIASKVVIIDEIHAYDAYMQEIIFRLLAWCGYMRVPVVMLSATLPIKRRRDFMRAYSDHAQPDAARYYPCLSHVLYNQEARYYQPTREETSKRIRVEHHPLTMTNYDRILEMLETDLANGGNAVVIVNTVAEAQNLFLYLNANSNGRLPTIRLFHARYLNRKRMTLEKRIIKLFERDSIHRPISSILIATQVVEQSLDIDFDIMYTELCPMDLLLQRMGRLWRHTRTRRGIAYPMVRVLDRDPDSPKIRTEMGYSDIIYSEAIIRRTRESVIAHPVFNLPEDIFSLVDSVYADPDEPDFEERIRLLEMAPDALARDPGAWAKKVELERIMGTIAYFATIPNPMYSGRRFWLFNRLTENANAPEDSENDFSAGITRFATNSMHFVLTERYIPPEEAKHMSRIRCRKLSNDISYFSANWLKDVIPRDGFALPEPIDSKLFRGINQLIVRNEDGRLVWRCYNRNNEPVVVAHDSMLGICRMVEGVIHCY